TSTSCCCCSCSWSLGPAASSPRPSSATEALAMDFYLGLLQIMGVHTLLGLSAYVVLQTGQVSLAQAGFMAIGAYVAAMLTVLAGWSLIAALIVAAAVAGAMACLVGFPALRVHGLMLVVATIAFSEIV